jgi:hypothetical protein
MFVASSTGGCVGSGDETTSPSTDIPQGTDPGSTEDPVTSSPEGFGITEVSAWNAQLHFVADVVQLASGEVVAVGLDNDGLGAIHLVSASQVQVLHAGSPLGMPTSVDLAADGTIYLTDAGGVVETSTDPLVPDSESVLYPTGGLFSIDSAGGSPVMVTTDVVSPQGVVVSANDIVYATGYTQLLEPGVFSIDQGMVTVLSSGAPLVQPTDISVVGDPDQTQLWVIDMNGGQEGVAHSGAALVALFPPAGDITTVADGLNSWGVTGRGADALVTTIDHNGDGKIKIIDVNNGESRRVDANGIDVTIDPTGAGAGADAALPVWAGGNSGQVYVSSN